MLLDQATDLSLMIYPNNFQMDMDFREETSDEWSNNKLWLEQGTGYVVAIMMMMHA